ncbi:hypothetical protein EDC01DRAFT_635379 [Geopyxis carbonaria]|nr:hypothetical protein EDC01DRAFT_635379 [Geopyxis carbonaria]
MCPNIHMVLTQMRVLQLKLWRTTETIASLRAASTSSRPSKFPELKKNPTKRSSFRKFPRIPSEHNPVRIGDINHTILVQRIQASPSALVAIEEADNAVSKNKKCLAKAKRADVDSSARFGVWADFDLGLVETRETDELADKGGNRTAGTSGNSIPCYTSEPRRSRKFEQNGYLRKCTAKTWRKSLKPATGLFCAVAINRKQKTDGIVHQDWADTESFCNAAMACGKN